MILLAGDQALVSTLLLQGLARLAKRRVLYVSARKSAALAARRT
jgi:predicted ATP-dependent serine protease